MNKANETVERINSWYVSDDCVQYMFPYKKDITILGKEGIIYHHIDGEELFINKYMEDERRKKFPYHNIPTHYVNFPKKIRYTNQLLEFNQPYILVKDGGIIETYVVKDKDEALAVNKVMNFNKSTSIKTRQELEEMFIPAKNEKLYFVWEDSSIPINNKVTIPSEKYILDSFKFVLQKDMDKLVEYVKNNPSSSIGIDFNKNQLFLNFIQQSINDLSLKNLKFETRINDKKLLIIRVKGSEITMQAMDIKFMAPNSYLVDVDDVLVTKYTLEQLKFLIKKVSKAKEPKISLRANPGILKSDIEEAKQMVFKIQNSYTEEC